jgi:hypothetical protein
MTALKSIGAVLAGFILVLILSVLTDFLLEVAGIFPPATAPGSYLPWMLAVALVYRSLYAVAGGYVTAALAPGRPMYHVIILGIIGLVFATLGAIANWNIAVVSGTWYPIALIILTLPCVWIGGRLRIQQQA